MKVGRSAWERFWLWAPWMVMGVAVEYFALHGRGPTLTSLLRLVPKDVRLGFYEWLEDHLEET